MPLAPAGNHGAQLLYHDSGAPATSNSYVTLVLFHGAVFHSPIFQRLFEFAAGLSLRLVTVTLRDYPGSTPLTPDELDALRSPDRDVQASMIKDRGHELAFFLEWFIRTENIPPLEPSDDPNASRNGGLAILAWSWGNCMALSFLSHGDSLPTDTKELLNSYMRTYVIYDPPPFVFGVPDPPLEEIYSPLRDPNIPREQIGPLFSLWVASYFSHSPSVLSSISTSTREELLSGLARSSMANPSPDREPTLQRMSAAEIAEVADMPVMARSHTLMMQVDRSIYYENAQRAFSNTELWPNFQAVMVWCDMSHPDIINAAWNFHKMSTHYSSSGGRKVVMRRYEGANHFAHWDQPERTLRLLAEIV